MFLGLRFKVCGPRFSALGGWGPDVLGQECRLSKKGSLKQLLATRTPRFPGDSPEQAPEGPGPQVDPRPGSGDPDLPRRTRVRSPAESPEQVKGPWIFGSPRGVRPSVRILVRSGAGVRRSVKPVPGVRTTGEGPLMRNLAEVWIQMS